MQQTFGDCKPKVIRVPLQEPGIDVNPVNVNAVKRKFCLHEPGLPLFEAG